MLPASCLGSWLFQATSKWGTGIWGFPKMVGFPNKPMGFPTRNDHFGVFWWYHHLRKHPYHRVYLWITTISLVICSHLLWFPMISWDILTRNTIPLQLSWFNDISQQLDRDFTYPIALDLLFSDSRFGQQQLHKVLLFQTVFWMFPKIVGFPPKSSILIGFSIIFTIHFGVPTPIFGNTHFDSSHGEKTHKT